MLTGPTRPSERPPEAGIDATELETCRRAVLEALSLAFEIRNYSIMVELGPTTVADRTGEASALLRNAQAIVERLASLNAITSRAS